MTNNHPSICMCSECQDEALATELQSDKARIAELERENTRLREQLDAGTEAGWHALRNERDALRARINDAPHINFDDHDVVGFMDEDDPDRVRLIGKRVALVVLD